MKQDKNGQDLPPQANRRTIDQAFILPLLGCLFLIPPFAGIFELDVKVLGIPFTAIYLFVVWALLIVGAARLSKRLLRHADWSIEPGSRQDLPRDSDA